MTYVLSAYFEENVVHSSSHLVSCHLIAWVDWMHMDWKRVIFF